MIGTDLSSMGRSELIGTLLGFMSRRAVPVIFFSGVMDEISELLTGTVLLHLFWLV